MKFAVTVAKWTGIALAALLALFLAAVFWPVPDAPLPDGGPDRLLTDVRVIDVEKGTASEPVDVRIRQGMIAAIAPALAPEPGETVTGGKGRFLVPGFWDMHVHSFQASPQLHLPLFVANGVTGVRDMMDCPQPTDSLIACVDDKRRWSDLAAKGHMATPRFVEVASFYFNDPDMPASEALRRAGDYRGRGVDSLKVYDRVSRTTYLALARQASVAGMPIVGHLPREVSLDEAIAAGQRSFEHGHVLLRHCSALAGQWRRGELSPDDPVAALGQLLEEPDDDACERTLAAMRAGDTWLVPTHITREEDARAGEQAFLEDPRLDYLDPLSRFAFDDDRGATTGRFPGKAGADLLARYFDRGLELTGAAYRAGVPVLVGTDTVIGGFRYHDELRHLVTAGLTPAEALRAATIEAARYARMEDRFGTVAVGKTADLLLLDANPLEDIANTRRISSVFVAGRLYDRKGLDALLEFTKAQAGAPHNWAKLVWGFVFSHVSAEL